MSAKAKLQQLADAYSDQLARLNSLYWIVDEDGNVVQFKMRPVQYALYRELWYRNIILKSRQHGFTTELAIMALDTTIFNQNYAAGIIAHKMSDAQKIFRNKIKFPYKRLPDEIKALAPIDKETSEEIVFGNGSSISVSTSFRSGTLQWLHISEYGKIAAKFPAKAEEIDTGALEAVHQNGVITIESTAEGNYGLFKDKVDQAVALQDSKAKLARLDWKLHFVPWWKDPKNKVAPDEVFHITIPERLQKYFEGLRDKHGIRLTPRQKAWYTVKERTQGQRMWREHPSISSEPFKVALDGAYWAEQMQEARKDGRITTIKALPHIPVRTWWDIGRDTTSIWFTQDVGNTVNCIHYYANSGKGLSFYNRKIGEILKLRDLVIMAGENGNNFPHDMGVRDWSNPDDKTRVQVAHEMGLVGRALPRMKDKEDGIEAGRNFISRCAFDETYCEEGISGLEAYRKEWDQNRGVWRDSPLHDWASHPADAFQQLALNHTPAFADKMSRPQARPIVKRSAVGWT